MREYRILVRSLLARLRAHCEQIGIRPPRRALLRYASLRFIESRWWLSDKLSDERRDLLDLLGSRLRLGEVQRGTPICLPDLPDSIASEIDKSLLAPWGDSDLMISLRDL